MKAIVLTTLLAALVGGAALAQTAPELSQPKPGQLLDRDYLTSTGEVVPRPGVPQASGPTKLDRSIQHRDDKIDKSICSNC
ncbi:conserved hypothetical protein [Methylocella silvestris BL2]|uniref:Uncharacterized protein n=1 Tax=Methylocella silvestris (strain DSM 15510 / CIP 108128 / LMG 27833 / NCIMB 13906 / BL2) TaxID=395965 RepID=B8ES43_METSB|nr:hypothetical protein [Methylocella silvestris]ACK52258.1 conserved hypothetical protein [Methylocella silvestris BL2]